VTEFFGGARKCEADGPNSALKVSAFDCVPTRPHTDSPPLIRVTTSSERKPWRMPRSWAYGPSRGTAIVRDTKKTTSARAPAPNKDSMTDLSEAGDAQLVTLIARFSEVALAEVYRRHGGASTAWLEGC